MTHAVARSAALKERILELARELIFRYGFTRVTVDEIAHELHISKTTFYKCFRSKEDLFDKVFRTYYRRIADGISSIMEEAQGDYGKAFRRAMLFAGEMLRGFDARAQEDVRRNAPEAWRNLRELQSRTIRSVIEKVLHNGISKGIVRKDTDPGLMAGIILATIERVLNGEIVYGLKSSIEKASKTVIDVLTRGILAEQEDTVFTRG